MLKQVIILRKDLNMRKGKMCAQSCHASLASLFDCNSKGLTKISSNWLAEGQTKIVVSVDSEDELREVYKAADKLDLPCSLILDAGKTEFKEATYTCVGIGPYDSTIIDSITGKLKLL